MRRSLRREACNWRPAIRCHACKAFLWPCHGLKVLLSYLPPDEDRDREFLVSCGQGDLEAAKRSLEGLQDPNVKPGKTVGNVAF